jgi:L-2-hydroxyglutarate oxidase
MTAADIIIIGGGIVGLATGYNLARLYPRKSILLLEKESTIAFHQTGRNSGVIHSGIYYKPGSVKAETCRTGKLLIEQFCARENLPYETCGKVIVAIDDRELPALHALYERGLANQIDCEIIDSARLRELEPFAAGIKAIHVRETGIVDYKKVCARLASLIEERDHRVLTSVRVTELSEEDSEVIVKTTAGDFTARFVINCAGLQSDRVAKLGGTSATAKIVPFRGEYFKLTPEAERLCRNLIYPVPDPQFPFLGVHFTRMIDGGVECGPNAVFAFAREGYRKRDVNLRDLLETLTYPGFRKLAARHWRMGAGEMWRSFSKRAFVRALQRLVPEIREEHLEAAPAGIRAQAVLPTGAMLDDFSFHERARIVNVINAPSPAATASLSIGRMIAERLARHF